MSLAAFALVASPLLAFLGVLRWATDLAVDADSARASIGIAVPDELLVAPILDGDDRPSSRRSDPR